MDFTSFTEEVHIYPKEQDNGQILKRIDFKFPISYGDTETNALCWDKNGRVETVVLLSRRKSVDKSTCIEIEID